MKKLTLILAILIFSFSLKVFSESIYISPNNHKNEKLLKAISNGCSFNYKKIASFIRIFNQNEIEIIFFEKKSKLTHTLLNYYSYKGTMTSDTLKLDGYYCAPCEFTTSQSKNNKYLPFSKNVLFKFYSKKNKLYLEISNIKMIFKIVNK